MAFSFTDRTGDGATTAFTFGLTGPDNGYIRDEDISVEVDGTSVSFTLTGPNSVELDVAPADQALVRIIRTMPTDAPYSDFTRGNAFGQRNVNNSFLQQLYLLHSLLDGFLPDDHYFKSDVNMGENRLLNVADPAADSDVITKGYGDENYGLNAATEAKNWANHPEDSLVPEGDLVDDYSALHHANKASADAAQVAADRVAVEALYDTFDDTYLGSKSTPPTLDNDGNPLQDGALYFDTTLNYMHVYDLGTTTWIALPVSTLAALTDVALASLSTGEVLTWNGANWVNSALPAATDTAPGVVEKSTSAENTGGTATDVYPDVAGVKEMIDTHSPQGGGPSVGTNAIIRTNAKNIIEDIELSDHKLTFTADDVADTLSRGTDDGYANGDTVYLKTTGTLPTGLVSLTEYYVVNVTATTLQVSLTFGGAAVLFSDAGTGTHTIYQAVNGISAGPITIETGQTVTIPTGSTWSIT